MADAERQNYNNVSYINGLPGFFAIMKGRLFYI